MAEGQRRNDSSGRPSDRTLIALSADPIKSPDKIDLRNLTFEFIIFISAKKQKIKRSYHALCSKSGQFSDACLITGNHRALFKDANLASYPRFRIYNSSFTSSPSSSLIVEVYK
jgi:hypothetical protein